MPPNAGRGLGVDGRSRFGRLIMRASVQCTKNFDVHEVKDKQVVKRVTKALIQVFAVPKCCDQTPVAVVDRGLAPTIPY